VATVRRPRIFEAVRRERAALLKERDGDVSGRVLHHYPHLAYGLVIFEAFQQIRSWGDIQPKLARELVYRCPHVLHPCPLIEIIIPDFDWGAYSHRQRALLNRIALYIDNVTKDAMKGERVRRCLTSWDEH
jgi:hypothetical protein